MKTVILSLVVFISACAKTPVLSVVGTEPEYCQDLGFLGADIINSTSEKEEKELNRLKRKAHRMGADTLVCCYNYFEENLNGPKGAITLLNLEVRAYKCDI